MRNSNSPYRDLPRFKKFQRDSKYKEIFENMLKRENNPNLMSIYNNYKISDLLNEFASDKSNNITNKQWKVIPKEQYWNALRNYIQYGEAFRTPETLIDEWLNIIYKNVITLDYMSAIAGHNHYFPEEELTKHFITNDIKNKPKGYLEWAKMIENTGFYDWCKLPDGSDGWSDIAINPLYAIITKVNNRFKKSEKLLTINRCLNIVHKRGDIASIFIEGGKKTCQEISNS